MLSPDLLHALAAMGHGDRLVPVDANYPATRGRRLIHLPGIDMPRALLAVLMRAWSFATRTVAVSADKPPLVRRPTA